MRRSLVGALVLVALAAPASAQMRVMEMSISDLQAAMVAGTTTSAEITTAYLSRIQAYDKAGPGLNAMIWVNWFAVADADALDREHTRTGTSPHVEIGQADAAREAGGDFDPVGLDVFE